MKDRKAYWIGGTLTGLLGVGLARIVAPQLADTTGTVIAVLGYALVIAGITILARATRHRPAETVIAVERDARD